MPKMKVVARTILLRKRSSCRLVGRHPLEVPDASGAGSFFVSTSFQWGHGKPPEVQFDSKLYLGQHNAQGSVVR